MLQGDWKNHRIALLVARYSNILHIAGKWALCEPLICFHSTDLPVPLFPGPLSAFPWVCFRCVSCLLL